jgi:hypothetical protein
MWGMLDITIDKPNGSGKAFRRATLDTGADLNVIAESALKGLDFPRHPWTGAPIDALGSSVTPRGEVMLPLRVRGRPVVYHSWFAIIEEARAASFDILLGKNFIEQNNFLVKDPEVWQLAFAGPGSFRISSRSLRRE